MSKFYSHQQQHLQTDSKTILPLLLTFMFLFCVVLILKYFFDVFMYNYKSAPTIMATKSTKKKKSSKRKSKKEDDEESENSSDESD